MVWSDQKLVRKHHEGEAHYCIVFLCLYGYMD